MRRFTVQTILINSGCIEQCSPRNELVRKLITAFPGQTRISALVTENYPQLTANHPKSDKYSDAEEIFYF
jgi:hypothetical protein